MRQAFSIVALSFLLSWSGSGARAQPVTVGGEFLVNAFTVGRQAEPSVASDSAGGFVVVWSSLGEDGWAYGVFGQRYDSSGSLQGSQFQVNSYTTYFQYRPSAAMDADGDFVVAWASFYQDGERSGVFLQRFDSSGAAQGVELQVNTYTTSSQNFPAVAMDGDGDFVVVWHSTGPDGDGRGVFGQRFDSAGLGLGGEFQISSYTLDYQERPAVAMADDGDFVVVWQSVDQDGSERGIFGQRFAAAGAALGAEFQVNSFTPDTQRSPTVAINGDGDFVVAWTSYYQDGSETGVFARRFDSSGTALGVAFQVNSHTPSRQQEPALSMDDAGDFVVVWESVYRDGYGTGVFAQFFDSLGVASGSEFQVNAYTPHDQGFPAAAMDADGDFVVAWQSYTQDGDDLGIFAQRFDRGMVGGGPIAATIDIKPGPSHNKINIKAKGGQVHVAILTTSVADGDSSDFDAWEVDETTVVFGPLAAAPEGSAQAEDVDGDGDLDMVLRFRIRATGISCGDTAATLSGETFGGEAFEATDSVVVQGC